MISENWPQVRGRGVSRVVITRYRSINRVDVHIYLFIRARLGLVIGEPNFIWHGILCNLWTKRNFHLRERVEHAPRDASFLRRPTHRDMYICIYTHEGRGRQQERRREKGRRQESRYLKLHGSFYYLSPAISASTRRVASLRPTIERIHDSCLANS